MVTMQTVEITAAQLMGVLEEDQDTLDSVTGETVIMCEGVSVAKVRPSDEPGMWDLVAIACDNPSHGVHPKYAKFAEKLAAQMAAVREHSAFLSPGQLCDKCKGELWLAPESSAAQLIMILTRVVRMFRGIAIGPGETPSGGLNSGAAAATINAFLSVGGASRQTASLDPTASSHGGGRVVFSEDDQQEPQVKEGTEDERKDHGTPYQED